MPSAAYYRREAERARAAAENSRDAETVMRWLRIAKDYRTLADAIAREEPQPSAPPVPTQQPQPEQQQQGKLGTDEPLEC
jgi:hypothetical protein